MQLRKPRLSMFERARRLASPGEALSLYRAWARDYDRDVYGALRFTGTARIAALLAEHAPNRSQRVIDLGCGTGAAGEALRRLGFEHLDGLDLSPDMLAVARTKSVYDALTAADLLQPLPFDDASYDAAISAGTFTTGHVGAGAVPEIVRIVRPNGVIACVVADGFWDAGGFAEGFEALRRSDRVSIVHASLEPVRQDGPPEGRFILLRVH